jgi:hypothetical protein
MPSGGAVSSVSLDVVVRTLTRVWHVDGARLLLRHLAAAVLPRRFHHDPQRAPARSAPGSLHPLLGQGHEVYALMGTVKRMSMLMVAL